MEVVSKRLSGFRTGIFAALDEKKAQFAREGKKVYNLSVGTPDFAPPKHVVEALCNSAQDPENWKYSLRDTDELLQTASEYYKDRFGVDISPDCMMSVHGTQEGMGLLGTAICDTGDVVLLPNPGYPIFEAGSMLAGADMHFYNLTEENGFLPVFGDIPEDILKSAKYIVMSYPSNPVGACAPKSVYEELISIAKKYDIIVINDNAYSDIVFEPNESFSFLSLEGASEVGVEFLSLSKSFSVTGARISFLSGKKEVVDALKLLRTQIDFGMFYPVQHAAIAAMKGSRECVEFARNEYKNRRDALCEGLRNIGWDVADSMGTMFVWAKIPGGFTSSVHFVTELFEKTGVLCTPGSAFGSMGEGYVRFALVLPPKKLKEIADIIGNSNIF